MHSITSQTLKWSLIAITIIAVVLVSVSAFAQSKKSERYDAGWNPESISESLQPGQSIEIPLTYVPDENVSDVSVIVSPEIASYVTVEPATIGKLKKGKPISLTATVKVSVTALPEINSGKIHLVEDKEKKKYRGHLAKWEDFWAAYRKDKNHKLEKPLSVSLEVLWPKAENLPGEVSVSYPVFDQPWTLQVQSINTGGTDNGPELIGSYAVGRDKGPEFIFNIEYGISVYQNSIPMDPDTWFQQNVDPSSVLIENGAIERKTLVNGMVAFVYTGEGLIPDGYDPVSALYALSPSGRIVVVIDAGGDNSLSVIGVTYELLIQAFIGIASSIQVPE